MLQYSSLYHLPRRMLSKAIAKLQAPIIITNTKAQILYVNKAFEKTTGYKCHEVLGKTPNILQSEYTPEYIYKNLWDSLNSGKVWTGEFTNRRKDGSIYSEAAAISIFKYRKKHYFIAIKHDITPMKYRRMELEEILQGAQNVLDSLPVFVSFIDNNYRFQFVNYIHSEIFNISKEQIIGKKMKKVLPDYLRDRHMDLCRKAMNGEIAYFEDIDPSTENSIQNVYGMYIPYIDSEKNIKGVVNFTFDITQRCKAEEEKNKARDQFDMVANNVPGIIYQLNLSKENKWSMGYIQGDLSILGKLGINIDEIMDNADLSFSLIPQEDMVELFNKIEISRRELSSFNWVGKFLSEPDNCWLQISATPHGADNGSVCWTGLAVDITDQKKAEERIVSLNKELTKQAETDYLTGLFNRKKFTELMNKELSRVSRYKKALSFCIMDLDHFKLINDKFGHETGDRVLKDFADRIRFCVRDVDISARIGGEEFAIFFPETSLEMSESVCNRLLNSFREANVEFSGSTEKVQYRCSIGLTSFSEGDDFQTLYIRADKLLYRAKELGRDQVVIDRETVSDD